MALVAVGSALGASYIGTDICIKTVSLTATKLTELIAYFAIYSGTGFDEFHQQIQSSDLVTKLNIIEKFLIELHAKETNGHSFPDSIKVSLNSIDDVVNKINVTIGAVEKMKEDHKQLYFNSWRSVDCTKQVAEIRLYVDLLKERFRFLMQIININHNIMTPSVPLSPCKTPILKDLS